MRRKVAWIAVSLLLVGGLSAGTFGCKSPSPTSTLKPSPTSTPTLAPTSSPTPKPVPKPTPTGELRWVLGAVPSESLDPMLVPGTGIEYLEPLYDFVVGLTPDGTEMSAESGLAYKWETSSDQLSTTFWLRKGIKFHDGSEVTAQDVKFSVERAIGPKSVTSSNGLFRQVVDKIEVVDPYTVVFRFKKQFAFLPYYLSAKMTTEGMVVPKKYIEEKGEAYFNLNPVGSGPYRFVKQQIGSYFEYEALDEHWYLGVPKFKRMVYMLAPEETTRIAMLKRGDADIISVSRSKVLELKSAGFSVFMNQGSKTAVISLDQYSTKSAPVVNKKVREAMNLAINRQEIIDQIFAGMGKSAASDLGSHPLGNPTDIKPHPYDPQRAKRLLAEAGYPNGFEFTLYLFNRPALPEGEKVGEAIAGYLEAIGIKVKMVRMDYAAVRKLWSDHKLGGGGTINYYPSLEFNMGSIDAVFHSKGMLPLVNDPQLDALIEDARAATSVDDFAKKMGAAIRYMYDNFNGVAIAEIGETYATNDKVKEWKMGGLYGSVNYSYIIRRAK